MFRMAVECKNRTDSDLSIEVEFEYPFRSVKPTQSISITAISSYFFKKPFKLNTCSGRSNPKASFSCQTPSGVLWRPHLQEWQQRARLPDWRLLFIRRVLCHHRRLCFSLLHGGSEHLHLLLWEVQGEQQGSAHREFITPRRHIKSHAWANQERQIKVKQTMSCKSELGFGPETLHVHLRTRSHRLYFDTVTKTVCECCWTRDRSVIYDLCSFRTWEWLLSLPSCGWWAPLPGPRDCLMWKRPPTPTKSSPWSTPARTQRTAAVKSTIQSCLDSTPLW